MGRHKQFVRDEVTEKALRVFQKKGYLDTSLKDLEEATGLFKPALYSEYGDKAGLFQACIDFYKERFSGARHLKHAPLGWDNIENFFRSLTPSKGQNGCFEVEALFRDIEVLEREGKIVRSNCSEEFPVLIKDNLIATGLTENDAQSISKQIFVYFCGASAMARTNPDEDLLKQTESFLDLIRLQAKQMKNP